MVSPANSGSVTDSIVQRAPLLHRCRLRGRRPAGTRCGRPRPARRSSGTTQNNPMNAQMQTITKVIPIFFGWFSSDRGVRRSTLYFVTEQPVADRPAALRAQQVLRGARDRGEGLERRTRPAARRRKSAGGGAKKELPPNKPATPPVSKAGTNGGGAARERRGSESAAISARARARSGSGSAEPMDWIEVTGRTRRRRQGARARPARASSRTSSSTRCIDEPRSGLFGARPDRRADPGPGEAALPGEAGRPAPPARGSERRAARAAAASRAASRRRAPRRRRDGAAGGERRRATPSGRAASAGGDRRARRRRGGGGAAVAAARRKRRPSEQLERRRTTIDRTSEGGGGHVDAETVPIEEQAERRSRVHRRARPGDRPRRHGARPRSSTTTRDWCTIEGDSLGAARRARRASTLQALEELVRAVVQHARRRAQRPAPRRRRPATGSAGARRWPRSPGRSRTRCGSPGRERALEPMNAARPQGRARHGRRDRRRRRRASEGEEPRRRVVIRPA